VGNSPRMDEDGRRAALERFERATELLAAVLGQIDREARRLVARHKLHYSVLVTGIAVLAAAGAAFLAEERAGGPID
jgi:hypothetical protein